MITEAPATPGVVTTVIVIIDGDTALCHEELGKEMVPWP